MISVIISVYNVAPYIEKCINSICQQTYSDLEIIAVDDGSTDESGAICDRLAQEDNRIVVVHKKNGGNASARNAGVDVAKGEFIAFVDADDYIESNMYEEMLTEMNNSSASIVSCGIIVTNINGEDKVVVSEERKFFSKEDAIHDFFSGGTYISATACSKLYRKELFNELRFNNDVIHEDTEAMPRFIDASQDVLVMDKAFYHYIKRENSASTSKCFSLRGYHFLDSMKEYERMCKMKYPKTLPMFHHYELISTYEMLLNLMGCVDHKQYKKQEISLRRRMLVGCFKCMKWKTIREEYENQIKEILVRAVLGVR